jgi:hypothetical protein
MSDAIENEMHCTPPELTQIAVNSMQGLIPPKSLKVYDFYIMPLMKSISISSRSSLSGLSTLNDYKLLHRFQNSAKTNFKTLLTLLN